MWRPLTIAEVRLTPTETAVMANIQGSSEAGAEILLRVIREIVSAIKAGGYKYATDETIPDSGRTHAINRTRWQWLGEFPALKSSQTKQREDFNKAAEEFMTRVSAGKESIEAPGPDTSVASAASGSHRRLRGMMGGEHQ